jgi:NAD(P)-dependent dehydrogenase (short-subunit alcohol dehydrogenase family)
VLATNLTAAFLGARSQIPAMLGRGSGSIIFTSSFVYPSGEPRLVLPVVTALNSTLWSALERALRSG